MTQQQPENEALDSDTVVIIDDVLEEKADEAEPWAILVVDDDVDVHHVTDYALADVRILGRALCIRHAFSAAEARKILEREPGFAVILLDVVMETSDAGLCLVDYIRNILALTEPRIVLRTGQPGYAPELEVFERYDINDYRTKSELNQARLVTSLVAAIRSYHQIRTIAEGRRGLEMIIHAAAHLMETHALNTFAEGVLTHLAALLDLPVDGLVCVQCSAAAAVGLESLRVVGAAGRYAEYLGRPLSQMRNTDIPALIGSAVATRQHQYGARHMVLYLHSGGQEGAIYIQSNRAIPASNRSLLEVFTMNISACYGNVRMVEELNHIAFYDTLTGLLSYNGLTNLLDNLEENWKGRVLALVDLVHFHDVNDGLGRDSGDSLLQAAALRLRAGLPDTCRVARIGGDVFAVVGPESAVSLQAIRDVFCQQLSCEGYSLSVAVSVGLCRIDDAGLSCETLVNHANIALNLAKLEHPARYAEYIPEYEVRLRERLAIIDDLHQAFAARRLSVWYQPQIDLRTGEVWGLEALARWLAEDGALVQPPAVFIPLAEYSGLIVELGDWVLEQACALFASLRDTPHAPPRIAVNASIAQFRATDFVARVAAILARHGLQPQQLELEITENLAMEDPRQVCTTLSELKNIGVEVALDDFGTGYSSLSRLDRLPFDAIKIDKSFVAEIGCSSGGDLTETIIALGRTLHLATIAEGVETVEQARHLYELGCDVGQGFLFARPMPDAALRTWLAQRQSGAPGF